MSSERDRLLRLMVQGDKEAVITAVTVTGDPAKFTSQLTQGYKRKRLSVRDLTDAASGEVYYGFSPSVTRFTGIPFVSGEMHQIHVADDIDLYFVHSVSGELGDLRVEEIS